MSGDGRGRADVALVTGSAGGLGRACCAALAAIGVRVVAADLDEAGAEGLVADLRGDGGSAAAVGLDVLDRAAVEALVAKLTDEHGGIDVVVNLAGTLRNQTLVNV